MKMAIFATSGWQVYKCPLCFLFWPVGLSYFTIKIYFKKCLASIVCVGWGREKGGEDI